jgi:hypothetical protein
MDAAAVEGGPDAAGPDAADADAAGPDAPGWDAKGPGWSMERLAALMAIGIAAGAGLGIATFEVIVGVAAIGLVTGGTLPTGSDLGYYALGLTFAGAAGAVLATAAAVGAIVALLLFDHWGERPPLYRAISAGLGAAAGAVVLLLVAGAPGLAGTLGGWVIVLGPVASGIAAGGSLYLFEKRMRKRDSVRSGTVEGDFGGRVPPGNKK